jgi:hypothetical protein
VGSQNRRLTFVGILVGVLGADGQGEKQQSGNEKPFHERNHLRKFNAVAAVFDGDHLNVNTAKD